MPAPKKSVTKIDPETGERTSVLVDLTPEEIAEREASAASAALPENIALTRAQFQWLLDVSGLDDVVTAILADTKTNNRLEYAHLRKLLGQSKFRLSAVLGLVAQYGTSIPAGVDVSQGALEALWTQAAGE